ncbi:MAG: NADH-quinone oxidoreductase subunit J [Chloroflexi bacterium]|nr:NADH-quinone oxidoreductase subunit J [Chloroflexota bacterium]
METFLFITTAIVAVGAALAMVLSSNAVHSALFLILNFCSVAILYFLLRAPFLGAVQVTVYAGAIMVLFLFVIMLLGAENAELGEEKIGWQKPAGLVLGVALLAEIGYVAYRGTKLIDAPVADATNIGAPTTISAKLFSTYLLPFEVISILLLIAVVGTVVLTRRRVVAREESQS